MPPAASKAAAILLPLRTHTPRFLPLSAAARWSQTRCFSHSSGSGKLLDRRICLYFLQPTLYSETRDLRRVSEVNGNVAVLKIETLQLYTIFKCEYKRNPFHAKLIGGLDNVCSARSKKNEVKNYNKCTIWIWTRKSHLLSSIGKQNVILCTFCS